MLVTGYRIINFTDRNDSSKTISGVRIICEYPITKNGDGKDSEKFFLSDWFIANRLDGELPKIGDDIEVLYSKSGKINDLRILKTAEEIASENVK